MALCHQWKGYDSVPNLKIFEVHVISSKSPKSLYHQYTAPSYPFIIRSAGPQTAILVGRLCRKKRRNPREVC